MSSPTPSDDDPSAADHENEKPAITKTQLILAAELNENAFPQYVIKLTEETESGLVSTESIRQFEDIQWLYHCLRKGCDKCGLIFPPMPEPPADFIEIDPEENIDRKLKRESKRITRYLDSLTCHPTLKMCPEVEIFLKEKTLPEKEEEKASVFSKFSSLFSFKSSPSEVKDIDDFFELEQIYATKYEQTIRQFSQNYSDVVECMKRLSGQHGHMATCLSMPVDNVSERGKKMSRINAQMMSYFKTFTFWMDAAISSCQVTLGQSSAFYWAYTSNELEMLQRRKELLLEYQEANAAILKAQGNKRSVAERTQKEVERKLEECSDTARDEIRWFGKKRSNDLLTAVVDYATERARFEHKILLAIGDCLEQLKSATE